LFIDSAALLFVDSVALLLVDCIRDSFAVLFINCIADLFIDGLALLLGDCLSDSLALFLLRTSAILLVDNMASLINYSLALLFSTVAADLVDDIGAFLFRAIRTLLLVDQIKNCRTNIFGNISANLFKGCSASSVIYSLAFTLLHNMTHRVADGGAFPFGITLTSLLIDGVGDTAALLLFVGTATLGICDAASTILNGFAFLLVGHFADFIIDGVTLFLFDCAALILIDCVASWTSPGIHDVRN